MAAGPLLPESNNVQEKRLVDRAQFLGEAGRQGKQVENDAATEEEKAFHALLDEECDDEMREEAEKLVQDDGLMSKDEVESHNQRQTYKEAERRGGWRGPTAVIGLSVAGGAPPSVMTNTVSGDNRTRRDKEKTSTGAIKANQAQVDPTLLQSLRTSGLDQPLTGLNDPRLTADEPNLDDPTWKQGPMRDGVSYVWSGPMAHQKLEWCKGRRLLESAAGTMIQTLEQKGGQTFSRVERRDPPASFRIQAEP